MLARVEGRMHRYHLSRNGKVLGIYPEDKMKEYFAEGRVGPNDLVWREGLETWRPAWQVLGFEAAPGSATPAVLPDQAPASAASPSIGPTATQSGAALPLPPRMHWGWVLLLTIVTFGLFYIVWAFVQARWIHRIDPASNATTLLVVYVVLALVGRGLAEGNPDDSASAGLGDLLVIAGWVVSFVAFFSMRRSMVNHYNRQGPIGLRLSAVMTFFLNVLYFQHHMTRIARGKTTGGTAPQ